jgi:hypothetical protein
MSSTTYEGIWNLRVLPRDLRTALLWSRWESGRGELAALRMFHCACGGCDWSARRGANAEWLRATSSTSAAASGNPTSRRGSDDSADRRAPMAVAKPLRSTRSGSPPCREKVANRRRTTNRPERRVRRKGIGAAGSLMAHEAACVRIHVAESRRVLHVLSGVIQLASDFWLEDVASRVCVRRTYYPLEQKGSPERTTAHTIRTSAGRPAVVTYIFPRGRRFGPGRADTTPDRVRRPGGAGP